MTARAPPQSHEVPSTYEEFCAHFVKHAPAATLVGDRAYSETPALAGFRSGEQRKPYSKGLPLGMVQRGAYGREFVPSLALLRILAQHAAPETKAILRDAHTQHLFLCGRDIFTEGFIAQRTTGFVLVQNENDENLGLGQLVPGERGLLVRNVLDRGNYLRHERVTLAPKTPRRKLSHGRPERRR